MYSFSFKMSINMESGNLHHRPSKVGGSMSVNLSLGVGLKELG